MFTRVGKLTRNLSADWQGVQPQRPFTQWNVPQDRVTFRASDLPKYDRAVSEKHRNAIRSALLNLRADHPSQEWLEFAHNVLQLTSHLFWEDAHQEIRSEFQGKNLSNLEKLQATGPHEINGRAYATPWPVIRHRAECLGGIPASLLDSPLRSFRQQIQPAEFVTAVDDFIRTKGKDPAQLTGLDVAKLLCEELDAYLEAIEGKDNFGKGLQANFFKSLNLKAYHPKSYDDCWKAIVEAFWELGRSCQDIQGIQDEKQLSWDGFKVYLQAEGRQAYYLEDRDPALVIEVAERLLRKHGKDPAQATYPDLMAAVSAEREFDHKRDVLCINHPELKESEGA